MKFLIINGPNINFLGIREPDIYGNATYQDLVELINRHATKINVEVEVFQSNYEGALVDKIQAAYINKFDGIVINPAAYTHTSIALLDAIKSIGIPTIEVHISDVMKREKFRQISYIREACLNTIMGQGFNGYLMAMDELKKHLIKE